jgi:hypothetical protein
VFVCVLGGGGQVCGGWVCGWGGGVSGVWVGVCLQFGPGVGWFVGPMEPREVRGEVGGPG